MKKIIVLFVLLLVIGSFLFVKTTISQTQDIAGTFFGKPVSRANYMVILRAVLSFQTPWGGIPRDREQAGKRVWDDLILSYEDHRRQITDGKKELEEKITETLKCNDDSLNWKEYREEYEKCVIDRLSSPGELCENQG